MIPPQALIVPLFREFQALHLINTYWALILPQVPAPIAVFIFKKFFDGVPISLEQAAEVDGANWWVSYRKIALPLARPAIAAVSIFTFVWTWNNFLWPFLAATSQTMMTIPAGLGTVTDGVGIINALQMAEAVLGSLPLVFVFLLAQRQIVEGVRRHRPEVAGTGDRPHPAARRVGGRRDRRHHPPGRRADRGRADRRGPRRPRGRCRPGVRSS